MNHRCESRGVWQEQGSVWINSSYRSQHRPRSLSEKGNPEKLQNMISQSEDESENMNDHKGASFCAWLIGMVWSCRVGGDCSYDGSLAHSCIPTSWDSSVGLQEMVDTRQGPALRVPQEGLGNLTNNGNQANQRLLRCS